MVYLFLDGASFLKVDSGGDVGCLGALSLFTSWGMWSVFSSAFCSALSDWRFKSNVINWFKNHGQFSYIHILPDRISNFGITCSSKILQHAKIYRQKYGTSINFREIPILTLLMRYFNLLKLKKLMQYIPLGACKQAESYNHIYHHLPKIHKSSTLH